MYMKVNEVCSMEGNSFVLLSRVGQLNLAATLDSNQQLDKDLVVLLATFSLLYSEANMNFVAGLGSWLKN